MGHTTAERFQVEVTEESVRKAVLSALLEINEHHDGCARPGSDCPVGAELKDVAKRAAPLVLFRLLGV